MPVAHDVRWRRHVTDLVTAGQLSEEAIDSIVDAGLAGYAVDRLADATRETDAVREMAFSTTRSFVADPRIKRGRLLLAARHATLKRAVVELLDVWRRAGIETLLVKGFYLAEFVYRDPSIRLYSDIDLALRSAEAEPEADLATRAAAIAAEHGWAVAWRLGERSSVGAYHDDDYQGHELLQLKHVATGASLDAHRRLVHKNSNLSARHDAGDEITSQLWVAARSGELDDVPVWLPQPVDAALVGLIAARSWSGDRYRLRPHDLLDLEALMAYGRFDIAALLERARHLGLVRTARLFLRRCDPVARTVDLREPSAAEVLVYDTLLLPERGHRGFERLIAGLANVPGETTALLRALPEVSRQVRRRSRGEPAAWEEPVHAGRAAGRSFDRRSWRLLQRGVRRAMQLHGVLPEQHGELALVCLLGTARAHGYPVERRLVEGQERLLLGSAILPVSALGHASDGGNQSQVTRLLPLRRLGFRALTLRLEALVRLRRVVSALEKTSFKALHEELLPTTPTEVSQPPLIPGNDCIEIGRAVVSATRFVPGAQCVAQALTAQIMLRRRAVTSVIHFGFKRSADGRVEGHAWLEANDAVITGGIGLDELTRTATFDA